MPGPAGGFSGSLQTAATATASGQFGSGGVVFGAPGGITSGGTGGGSSISRDVFVGVLTAVAVFVVFKFAKR